MDIQYLLWLQEFRNSINEAWTPFMEWVSMFAVTYLIMIPIFYYWCVDKKKGLFTLVAYYFCMVITPLTKLTCCIYRPWIRDSRVLPAGDAITTATGYSFPSGHTSTAGPLAGGMGVNLWGDKKTCWLAVICFLFVPLTAFSRNYLGVHTPQDVFVGICVSVLSIILAAKVVAYVEANPEQEDKLLIGGLIFCCIALIYITLKPYPMELNADGELIVDPQKMMNDGYGDIGKMMGFLIARFIEKRWVRFEAIGINAKGIILSIIGLVILWALKQYVSPMIVAALGSHWGKLVFSILYASYYIVLFPIVLKFAQKKA